MNKKRTILITLLLVVTVSILFYNINRFINEKKILEEIILRFSAESRIAQILVTNVSYDEKTKNIPIIVLSAKDGMKDLFAIEGIKDYLVKPVDHDQLLSLVRSRIG